MKSHHPPKDNEFVTTRVLLLQHNDRQIMEQHRKLIRKNLPRNDIELFDRVASHIRRRIRNDNKQLRELCRKQLNEYEQCVYSLRLKNLSYLFGHFWDEYLARLKLNNEEMPVSIENDDLYAEAMQLIEE